VVVVVVEEDGEGEGEEEEAEWDAILSGVDSCPVAMARSKRE